MIFYHVEEGEEGDRNRWLFCLPPHEQNKLGLLDNYFNIVLFNVLIELINFSLLIIAQIKDNLITIRQLK